LTGYQADSLQVTFDQFDAGALALLLASLGFLASAVVLAVAWRSRRRVEVPKGDVSFETSSQDADWRRQARSVLNDATAIVDLSTPAGVETYQPSTPALSAVMSRLSRLEQRLVRLAGVLARTTDIADGSRITEAISDLRSVASSLTSALDAERALRLGAGERSPEERLQSSRRITRRSSELNLAAGEFGWLIEAED
jgi:hypothetical protein